MYYGIMGDEKISKWSLYQILHEMETPDYNWKPETPNNPINELQIMEMINHDRYDIFQTSCICYLW
jgi:hypothetical protein